jgi:HAD superfamily hydrolase (TIGR01509 family)
MYKRIIENKKAVFFDLDGTIVDTTPHWVKALQKVIDELEIRWIEAEKMYIPGVPLKTLWANKIKFEQIKLELNPDQLVEKTNNTFIKEVTSSGIEPAQGYLSFLHEVKVERGLKVALLTNSKKAVANVLLEELGLINAYDLILTGDDVKHPKPNPEILNKASKMLAVSSRATVVFEDSPTGSEAAAAAGIDQVIIYNERVPKSEYKGNILFYLPNFLPLPDNLDQTYIGAMGEAVKKFDEIKKNSGTKS